MTIALSDINKKLIEQNYKLTSQRQLILDIFLKNLDKHLSAEDVHYIIKQQNSEIGLATVYRTLELLSDLNVLHKIHFGDGKSRYEINQANDETHHHHHLICLNCHKVIEFEEDLLETLETVISKNSKFKIIDHQVKFHGYCEECQKELEDK
ncbi:transcriptional repressor [Selenomonadales bacterium OttesenSCG-928-I06]|nr:transcriptional repressor [Selenomonadales bacterium OttesenSCG-928-I06]